MEPPGRNQQEQEYRFPPTVTRDKWRTHILTKIARGYVLIISPEKRIANFFMRGKGYETCAFDVAKQLVNSGLLVKAFDHHLGTAYTLAEPLELTPPPPTPKPVLDDDDDDDMSDLLDELAESNPEEEDDFEDDIEDEIEDEDVADEDDFVDEIDEDDDDF